MAFREVGFGVGQLNEGIADEELGFDKSLSNP
jgi:hypothetical protein